MVEILDQANLFYDLTVKKNHNYFVSKLGVLVHNEPLSFSIIAATIGPKIVIAAGYAVKTVALGIFGYFCVQDLLKSDNSAKPVFPSYQLQPLFSGKRIATEQTNKIVPEIENTQTLLFTQLGTSLPDPQMQVKTNIANNKAEAKPELETEVSTDDSASTNTNVPNVDEKDVVQEVLEQTSEDKAAQAKQADEETRKAIAKITDPLTEIADGKTKIFENPEGTTEVLDQDFEALPLTNVTEKQGPAGKVKVGYLPNGCKAIARHSTKDGRSRLEIQKPTGQEIKIRYGQ